MTNTGVQSLPCTPYMQLQSVFESVKRYSPWEGRLTTVAKVAAVISALAWLTFALQGAALGAAAPVIITVGVTGALAVLAALVIRALVHRQLLKRSTDATDKFIQALPKWGERLSYEDSVSFEELDHTTQFFENTFDSFKKETLDNLWQENDMVIFPNRIDGISRTEAIYYPNRALQLRYRVCPITGQPFVHPFICREDGHTYEREAFKAHWKQFRSSPITGQKFTQVHLFPNYVLYEAPRREGDTLEGVQVSSADKGKDSPMILC